jgi:hypothetical protein
MVIADNNITMLPQTKVAGEHMNSNIDGDAESDCDDDLAFANLDLTGVNFDETHHDDDDKRTNTEDTDETKALLDLEYGIMLMDDNGLPLDDYSLLKVEHPDLVDIANMIANGRYVDALNSPAANWLNEEIEDDGDNKNKKQCHATVYARLRSKLSSHINTLSKAVEVELLGIAAFNLFLQLNYTGPVIEDADQVLREINPHASLAQHLQSSDQDRHKQQQTITARRDTKYYNSVLSELAVDGQWPCQVAEVPYLLLLSRCIFSVLVSASTNNDGGPATDTSWMNEDDSAQAGDVSSSDVFNRITGRLSAVHLWHARAVVAHERLLMATEPSQRLWNTVSNKTS